MLHRGYSRCGIALPVSGVSRVWHCRERVPLASLQSHALRDVGIAAKIIGPTDEGLQCSGASVYRDDRAERFSFAIVLAVTAFAVAPNGSLERISAATVTAPGPVAIGDTVTGITTADGVDA